MEQRILYRIYPNIINNLGHEIELLTNLADSYLYKDILSYYLNKKLEILEKLLQALAHQIVLEVSFNELSRVFGINKNTLSIYIDILENNYMIFRLPSSSKKFEI